jgi:hypothetical protein
MKVNALCVNWVFDFVQIQNDGILYIKESEKKEKNISYLMELLEQWVFFKNDT